MKFTQIALLLVAALAVASAVDVEAEEAPMDHDEAAAPAEPEEADVEEEEGEEPEDLDESAPEDEDEGEGDEEEPEAEADVQEAKYAEANAILRLLNNLEKKLRGQIRSTKTTYDVTKSRFERAKGHYLRVNHKNHQELNLIRAIRRHVQMLNSNKGHIFTSCWQVMKAGFPKGVYKIKTRMGTRKVYCQDGWALVATVRVRSNQQHGTRNAVRTSRSQYVRFNNPHTQKFDDGWINALRAASSWRGSTDYKMTCFENGSTNRRCRHTRTMYIFRGCHWNSIASASSACERASNKVNGHLKQFRPNSGTRGAGHHHDTSVNWSFAWLRHPEQGNNSGCRNDRCGGGDGHLWIR